jgi:hypothetical protein
MRTIFVPGYNRHVSLKSYVNAVKFAKMNPDTIFNRGLTCWWPCTGREIVRQFRDGAQARINEAIPYINRGIKEQTP